MNALFYPTFLDLISSFFFLNPIVFLVRSAFICYVRVVYLESLLPFLEVLPFDVISKADDICEMLFLLNVRGFNLLFSLVFSLFDWPRVLTWEVFREDTPEMLLVESRFVSFLGGWKRTLR